VLRLGRRAFGPEELLVMAVMDRALEPGAAMQRVHVVVAEGADILEVSAGPVEQAGERAEIERIVPFIATVRAAYPELIIGVRTGRFEVAREACAAGADLLRSRDLGLAAEFGAGVACPLAWAARAVEAGVEQERIVVTLPEARQLRELVASGWPVLVSPADGDLATTAVAAWLGARLFRVQGVRATRRVLSMVSAIRGDIPPGYAVRGLA
jgi:dihydropteroate synthase